MDVAAVSHHMSASRDCSDWWPLAQVCRHHAAIVASGSGTADRDRVFTCPYHGAFSASAATWQQDFHTTFPVLRLYLSKDISCTIRKQGQVQSWHGTGWQYDRSGRLVRATKLKGIRDFKAKDYGLVPLRVATWLRHFTLVDTSPSESPAPPASDWLGTIMQVDMAFACMLHRANLTRSMATAASSSPCARS